MFSVDPKRFILTERHGKIEDSASQTFSYDAFGNINKSGNPYSFNPTYSSATNHMTQIGSSTPTYDADGNVTNDFLHTYAWDAYGRPVTIDGVGVTYDALGRMVEQNNSGTYMQIVWSPTGSKLAYMNGQSLEQGNFSLPAGAVVAYNSSALLVYHHADWLGSYRLASTPNRTVYWDGAYAPFGEPYAQSGSQVDLSFTGMNQDTVHNLYDFPAREYGIQGRWPSPDPAGMSSVDIGNPQTWNRYAYANNNPLMVTDPTGMYGDATALSALMGGGLYGPSVGVSGQTDLDSWGQEVDQEKAALAAAQAAQQATGTSQNSQSAAQSSGQTASQNSDSGSGDGCSYVLQDPCGTNASVPSSVSVTSQTYLLQPGQDSIGAHFGYQVLDQDSQPFTGGAGWVVTEYITGTALVNGQLVTVPPPSFNPQTTVMNSSGTLTDNVYMWYTNVNGPASQGRDQTLYFTPPGWPITGPVLPYSVTVGWFLQATGPNQGVILGSNGAAFSH